MLPKCCLEGLSTELLLKIFNYLDICDLCHLRQTCTRFNNIINTWDHLLVKTTIPIATNQRSSLFLSKCMHCLPVLEQLRISKNWTVGRYREKSLLSVKSKYLPWLQLNNKFVWLSRERKIFCYERNKNHINVTKPHIILQGESVSDVAQFQLKNDLLVSGHRDGSIWLKQINENRTIFDLKDCHDSELQSVDISRDGRMIVSGSRDNYAKIWKVNYEPVGGLEELHCCELQDRVWRVSLSDEKPLLAVGTSANNYPNSLFIYDVNRISEPTELPSTVCMGVLDIKWDGPHTLWSCGYDSYLKKWDIRTGRCEQVFMDPFGAALYCLDYDYVNTVVTGTQLHGRVMLWDTRQTNAVAMYFMDSCKSRRQKRSSPVYSLSFDSEFLFAATDQNLNVLKFSIYDGAFHDYSAFL